MRMQECDEVQIGATQLVDQSRHEGPNVLLIHVCQCCAEIAVVAVAHTLGCLLEHKLNMHMYQKDDTSEACVWR